MKKGKQIWTVHIDKGRITAITKDREIVKLTRHQRNALMDYKNPKYVENIKKKFQNNGILHNDFCVVKDDTIVFKNR